MDTSNIVARVAGQLVSGVFGWYGSRKRQSEDQERRAVKRKIVEFFSSESASLGFPTEYVCRHVGHSRELVYDVLIELSSQDMVHQLNGKWHRGPERPM